MAGIGQMLMAIIVAIALMVISIPLIQQYGGTQAAQNVTGIIGSANTAIQSNIYNPINNSVNNKTNTGFFAPITQFSGYAFVFGNIGSVIYTTFQLPATLNTMVSAVLNPISPILGVSGTNTSLILGLFESGLFIFLLIEGISAWMKFQLW